MADVERQLKQYLELQLLADTTVTALAHQAGVNVSWDIATVIGRAIVEDYDDYDGFVVFHSIDNAAYIANLVAFLFEQCGKPIVFTGASPLDDLEMLPHNLSMTERSQYQQMSLQANLLTAILLATMDCSGVMLVYGSQVVRAVRALEHSGSPGQPFIGAHEADFAKVQFGIQLQKVPQRRRTGSPLWHDQFVTGVMPMPLLPGLQLDQFERLHCPAIIVTAGKEQLVGGDRRWPKDIPVVIHDTTSTVPPPALPANVWTVSGITLPALLTKTMVGLARTNDVVALRQWLMKPLHDEFFHL